MIAKLDGRPVPLATFWWRQTDSAQASPNAQSGQYELAIPRVMFIKRLHSRYEQCVTELRAGDQAMPDIICPLRAIGYPPLAEVLRHARALEYVLRVFLYKDVFAAVVPLSPLADFMLDSVDKVIATSTSVWIRGSGYHRKPEEACSVM